MIVQSLRFYGKPILGPLEIENCQFRPSKCARIHKNQNPDLQWQVWNFHAEKNITYHQFSSNYNSQPLSPEISPQMAMFSAEIWPSFSSKWPRIL